MKEVNAIVRQYALNHGGCYEESWNKLYHLYNKVAHKNIKRRARNKKVRPLKMIEMLGDMETLEVLAYSLFKA